MSDLAQSLVTVLRDKALSDLLNENESLRQQLKQIRAVTVTGPEGTPVYATGQFDEGIYANNPNLWQVTLRQLQPCPLAELENIEIQYGGVLKAKFTSSDDNVEAFVDDPEIKDGWGEVNFCFRNGYGGLWLDIRIGAPLLPDVFLDLRTINNEVLHRFLSEDVAEQHPHWTVQFDHISFFLSEVRTAVQCLKLDPAMVEDARIRLQESQQRRGNTEAEEAVDWEAELRRQVNAIPEERARRFLAMPETFPVDLDVESRAVLQRLLRERFDVEDVNEGNEDVNNVV